MTRSIFSNISVLITTIFLFSFLITSQMFSQSSSNEQSANWKTMKEGGVIFRVTGTHPIKDYNNYASIFSERDKNFSFTIGLGTTILETDGYANGIKLLQEQGNELLDPTPNYKTNYFITKFDTLEYKNLTGIDHIIGNKICLEFEDIDPSKRVAEGFVTIFNDQVFGENEFNSFDINEKFLYFPSLDKLVLIDEILGHDNLRIRDVWDEPINLGKKFNVQYYLFSVKDISITTEGMVLLGTESIKLAEYFELERPYSWIQPGGAFPNMLSEKVKLSMGDQLGYLSGEVYSYTPSLLTYNEYDPKKDKRYGMLWGNFYEDEWTIEECKNVIANFVAKNRTAISRTYFGREQGGDLSGYLYKTAELLDWCIANDIPVATHSQWAEIIYDTPQNPYINIWPELNKDLDENGFPDGYTTDNQNFQGVLDKKDGIPTTENYSMSVNGQTGIFYIEGLGGLEKGENHFEIYTKGSLGNFITVTFMLEGENITFKFPAETVSWTKFDLSQSLTENKSLFIPDSISLLNIAIYCSDYTSGNVKISGMSLKSAQIDEISPSVPQQIKAKNIDNKVEITWAPNSEEDIQEYNLCRSIDPNFNPDTSSVYVYSTNDTMYVDSNVQDGFRYYYKVSAIDFAGNRSEYSSSTSVQIITGVLQDQLTPEKYELYQNFPNPFNPTTKITFALPNKSNVKLGVYNAIGQKVVELINTDLPAGYHEIGFNADAFSSGIYFYRITAGSFIEVKKMMLIK